MRLFRLAVEEQRWDLAAHTLVLAAARLLSGAGRPPRKQRRKKTDAKKVNRQRGIRKQA